MKAVELSRVKDEKSLDFFFREVEVMRVRKFHGDPSTRCFVCPQRFAHLLLINLLARKI